MAVRLIVSTESKLEPGESAQLTITATDVEGSQCAKPLIVITTQVEDNRVRTAVYEADSVEDFAQFAETALAPEKPKRKQDSEPTVDELFPENTTIDLD